MYSKNSRLINSVEDLSNYVEDFDIYNSYFLYLISDPSLIREDYQIKVYSYRPDLIARDFYGSEKYLGILMAQTKLRLDGFKKGTILSLIPKKTIDEIIKNL